VLSLALSMIRNHKAGLAGVFVAVLFGSAVVTACGILIDSGIQQPVLLRPALSCSPRAGTPGIP
jgi:hypothetical protein